MCVCVCVCMCVCVNGIKGTTNVSKLFDFCFIVQALSGSRAAMRDEILRHVKIISNLMTDRLAFATALNGM